MFFNQPRQGKTVFFDRPNTVFLSVEAGKGGVFIQHPNLDVTSPTSCCQVHLAYVRQGINLLSTPSPSTYKTTPPPVRSSFAFDNLSSCAIFHPVVLHAVSDASETDRRPRLARCEKRARRCDRFCSRGQGTDRWCASRCCR